jgi:exodeoxyribonuclease VIII
MQIELSGHIRDMPNGEYQATDAVSKSQLDAMTISPLAYWDAYVNPDREPREEKHCFIIGGGTHTLVLERHLFEQHYAVGFDKSKFPDALDTMAQMKVELAARGMMVSGAKPELIARLVDESDFPASRIMAKLEEHHIAQMGSRIAIDARSYKDMLGMLSAINSHHTASGIIEGCFAEQSYFVRDDADGILRKCRPDIITRNGQVVGDLKTTDDVSKIGFGRTIAQRRYHVQAAWYLDILDLLYGESAPKTFCFIAVQKTRPYDVAVHVLTDDQIEEGRRLYKIDLQRLIQCRKENYWPGADGGNIIAAEMPNWAMNYY